ncbi:MAG TPA: hypothetical protein VFK54_09910 [Candidatus Limnocylindrales bacterium]|nr:hypothetical protein [Candidatus Limnocylindrales bacterium]
MDRMYFVGVDTTGSQIRRIFPRWAELLGLDAELVGIDIPLGAEADAFREAMATIATDPASRGGLVTTHKVSVYRHALQAFHELDRWATLCGEVSCVARRDGRLHGWAKDPITSWEAFVAIAGPDYFARYRDAEVLCLGAGGSGTAFTARLLVADHPPARITVTNRSPERLSIVRELHARIGSQVAVEYRSVELPEDSDTLVGRLPPHSVVVNATGLGKDRPGSPITDAAEFPVGAIAWEFNYRGDLQFLEQARRQADARRLTVEDGWRYFLEGWASHVAEVFGLAIGAERFAELAAAAAELQRTSAATSGTGGREIPS